MFPDPIGYHERPLVPIEVQDWKLDHLSSQADRTFRTRRYETEER